MPTSLLVTWTGSRSRRSRHPAGNCLEIAEHSWEPYGYTANAYSRQLRSVAAVGKKEMIQDRLAPVRCSKRGTHFSAPRRSLRSKHTGRFCCFVILCDGYIHCLRNNGLLRHAPWLWRLAFCNRSNTGTTESIEDLVEAMGPAMVWRRKPRRLLSGVPRQTRVNNGLDPRAWAREWGYYFHRHHTVLLAYEATCHVTYLAWSFICQPYCMSCNYHANVPHILDLFSLSRNAWKDRCCLAVSDVTVSTWPPRPAPSKDIQPVQKAWHVVWCVVMILGPRETRSVQRFLRSKNPLREKKIARPPKIPKSLYKTHISLRGARRTTQCLLAHEFSTPKKTRAEKLWRDGTLEDVLLKFGRCINKTYVYIYIYTYLRGKNWHLHICIHILYIYRYIVKLYVSWCAYI